MIWLLLLILLVVVFGIGDLLGFALLTLVLVAVVVGAAVLAIGRAIAR